MEKNPPTLDLKGIARALRKQLDAKGLTLTHSETLELLAKTAHLDSWNVLAPRQAKPVTGPFCPKCGQTGTTTSVSTVFVEQGPHNGKCYVFEGDADHLACTACGHQWVDWQSDYPAMQAVEGTVILLSRHLTRYDAKLFDARDVLPFIEVEDMSPAALTRALNTLLSEGYGHQDLLDDLRSSGNEPQARASGETENDAVKALVAQLSPAQDAQVLNRSVGIF